jgi:biopolymer transport protein ExbD
MSLQHHLSRRSQSADDDGYSLADVAFSLLVCCLLIVFKANAEAKKTIKIETQGKTTVAAKIPKKSLNVSVDMSGQIKLDGAPTTTEQLEQRINALGKNVVVDLSVPDDLDFKKYRKTTETLTSLGIEEFSLSPIIRPVSPAPQLPPSKEIQYE